MSNESFHPVDRPQHYNSHPSKVQTIELVEPLSFCIGNAVKYLFRAGLKGDAQEDKAKACWYLRRERTRLRHGDLIHVPKWRPSSPKHSAAKENWESLMWRVIYDEPKESHLRMLLELIIEGDGSLGVDDLSQALAHIEPAADRSAAASEKAIAETLEKLFAVVIEYGNVRSRRDALEASSAFEAVHNAIQETKDTLLGRAKT